MEGFGAVGIALSGGRIGGGRSVVVLVVGSSTLVEFRGEGGRGLMGSSLALLSVEGSEAGLGRFGVRKLSMFLGVFSNAGRLDGRLGLRDVDVTWAYDCFWFLWAIGA